MPSVQINGVSVDVTFNEDGSVDVNGTTVRQEEPSPITFGYDAGPWIGVRGSDYRLYFLPVGDGSVRLGQNLVDQRLWTAVMDHNPSHFTDLGDLLPVERLTYADIEEFLRRLNSYLPEGWRVRMHTEAEYRQMLDEDQLANKPINPNEVVCYETPGPEDNPSRKGTRPVNWSKPNAKGFRDVIGNLYNATSDFWSNA